MIVKAKATWAEQRSPAVLYKRAKVRVNSGEGFYPLGSRHVCVNFIWVLMEEEMEISKALRKCCAGFWI